MCDHGNGMLLIVVRWQPGDLPGPTKVSKNASLRAIFCRKNDVVGVTVLHGERVAGLIHQVIAGEANPGAYRPAAASASGLIRSDRSPRQWDTGRDPHRSPSGQEIRDLGIDFAVKVRIRFADGLHSRRRLCATVLASWCV